jgi:hypothetical protein
VVLGRHRYPRQLGHLYRRVEMGFDVINRLVQPLQHSRLLPSGTHMRKGPPRRTRHFRPGRVRQALIRRPPTDRRAPVPLLLASGHLASDEPSSHPDGAPRWYGRHRAPMLSGGAKPSREQP